MASTPRRFGIWLLIAACLSPAAAVAADEVRRDSRGFALNFVPRNQADDAERCRASDVVYDVVRDPLYGIDVSTAEASDPDFPAIDMVLREDIRLRPFAILKFFKMTDYYQRRAELQAKFDARIAALADPVERSFAEGNRAMTLMYLGEFEAMVKSIGPRVRPGGDLDKNGVAGYAVSQALFRLGRYQESLDLVRRVQTLLPEAARDTRWQLMLNQLALYGKDFMDRFSCEGCTSRHVRAGFPNDDPTLLPFEDVTDKLGIPRWGGYGTFTFADFDGDTFDDLLWERKYMPPMIFANKSGRSFERVPARDYPAKACNFLYTHPADYDNDGKPDLFRDCCNFDGPGADAELFHNEGNLRFKLATPGSGLESDRITGTNNCWGDLDLDGDADLVLNDMLGHTRLYMNQGNGKFSEEARQRGVRTPGSPGSLRDTQFVPGEWGALGCSIGDFDGDRWPDLFVQGFGWKQLYRNNADGSFRDVTKEAGIDSGKNKKGYYGFFFDYNNDGKLDLLAGQYVSLADENWNLGPICECSNILTEAGTTQREKDAATVVYRNNGDGTFTNMQKQIPIIPFGIMGYAHADWDNDGDQDFLLGGGGPYMQQVEPFLFYRNNGDGTFTNLTPYGMLPLWGKGHAIAFADYDHDGWLDVALNNGGFEPGDLWPSLLLHNTGGKNHWLALRLKPGPGVNGSALGAKVRVYAGGTQQLQEMKVGGTFGASGLTLHFGLGSRTRADRIVVEWPDRAKTTTELRDVPADQAIEIAQETGGSRRLWAAGSR